MNLITMIDVSFFQKHDTNIIQFRTKDQCGELSDKKIAF